MAIIGVSGKIGSGKDTVGKIIQYLTTPTIHRFSTIEQFLVENDDKLYLYEGYTTQWQIKKFADKLKDIVCLLLGCSREQLEDREFKNKELGEEWWKIKLKEKHHHNWYFIPYTKNYNLNRFYDAEIVKTTPRLLLQLLGTDCGRNIIHPNVWVNSLMAEYFRPCKDYSNKTKCMCYRESDNTTNCESDIPNWIITDMRFPNELETVKTKGGISIRVNRPDYIENVHTGKQFPVKVHRGNHESETALDKAKFDYTIENSGTIEELIEKVKNIMKKENLL